MIFSPRIRLKPLAQLCHRLATATHGGIEDRKIWHDEAMRGPRSQREMVRHVSEQLAAGRPIVEGLAASGDFFPPLFHQMVAVGDMSGKLDTTYRRLASYYDRSLAARRALMNHLSWPMLQLAMALAIVAILIWIAGVLPAADGKNLDLLGLGLIGSRGLTIYVAMLTIAAAFGWFLYEAVRRGTAWTGALQHMAARLPVLGPALQTLALSRFTWALQLVLDTPMDLRSALPLAIEATGTDYFSRFASEVAQRIDQGQTIHAALSATDVFPIELLDQIAVGEESGRLVETMAHTAEDYQQRAAASLSILAQIAGYVVWSFVAMLIIVLIFRVFSSYLDQINSLL